MQEQFSDQSILLKKVEKELVEKLVEIEDLKKEHEEKTE